jgi:Concanavalin A-like lectin/glucanases superfamily
MLLAETIRNLMRLRLLLFISWAVSMQTGFAQRACVPAPAGLVEWLTFDKEAGPGRVGHGLQLDGKTGYRQLPGWQVGAGDFTVDAWIRTGDATVIRNYLDNRDATARGFLLFVRNGEAGFQVSDGGQPIDTIGAGYQIADNKWHHIAGVVKRLPPQPMLLYVDGKLRGQSGSYAPRANLDHGAPLWLGRHHANRYVPREDYYFEGAIDEATLYRAALTSAEIGKLYRAGAAGKCATPGR